MFKKITNVFSQYRGLSRSAYVIFYARIITNMGAFIWPLLTLLLKRKMGYDELTIGYISLGIGSIFIVANIFGGKLADRFNRKKLIVIFDLISVSFFISCAFVEPGTIMVVLFSIAGVFANIESPAFEALIADISKSKDREKVYSLSYLGHNLGFMIGPIIGGLLFENYLSLAFIIDGLTTLTSTILIILFVKTSDAEEIKEQEIEMQEINEYENDDDESCSTFNVLLRRKSVLLQLIIFIFSSFIYEQWSFAVPLYIEKLYMEKGGTYFGLISGYNGFIVIAFTPILTWLLRKVHELQKIFIGVFLYSFSFLLIRNVHGFSIFFVMMFAFTIGEIVNMLGASPYLSRRIPASHRGRVNSYASVGYFIGGVGGRALIGWIINDFSYATAFTVIACVGAVALLIILLNYKLDRKTFPLLYEKKTV